MGNARVGLKKAVNILDLLDMRDALFPTMAKFTLFPKYYWNICQS